MKILIIEDERPAFERLSKMLKEYNSEINILGNITGINDSINWFAKNKQPDLILLDVQLSDGLSLEIFSKVKITCPVIFTTAYDEYILDAFNYNGIDYLLKPIRKEKLFSALDKYKNLKEHFAQDYFSLFNKLTQTGKNYKERFTVKTGAEFISVGVEEAAYFVSEYKLVFLVTRGGKKYSYDKNLAQLEDELDPKRFFRANRNYIISINSIKSFKPFFKGKLIIDILPSAKEKIFISQEKAAQFKEWLQKKFLICYFFCF